MVDLVTLGVVVIVLGFLIIFLTTLISARSRRRDGGEGGTELKGGGVVMIGPIPIIFGTDPKWTSIAIVLAIILVVLSFIFMQYGVSSR
ncbi:MAG: TIGR00304 family protein [Thaumarchaeota archaeon]|nr:TIGR00304 family protein [Nitrososphaerota archaeon]MBI3116877.1 TIGR00304 family protein [Nitrososphaerota archaeon]MCS4539320.1 TIGR00304 family protein [Nitrososphaerota archaeon]